MARWPRKGQVSKSGEGQNSRVFWAWHRWTWNLYLLPLGDADFSFLKLPLPHPPQIMNCHKALGSCYQDVTCHFSPHVTSAHYFRETCLRISLQMHQDFVLLFTGSVYIWGFYLLILYCNMTCLQCILETEERIALMMLMWRSEKDSIKRRQKQYYLKYFYLSILISLCIKGCVRVSAH